MLVDEGTDQKIMSEEQKEGAFAKRRSWREGR
jgi:hypothetical protein